MKPWIVALLAGVASGAGFVVTSGTIHGAALVGVQAGIAAVDTVLSAYGVQRATAKG